MNNIAIQGRIKYLDIANPIFLFALFMAQKNSVGLLENGKYHKKRKQKFVQ